ncbi:MAG TPA: YncE family protein [Terracidiphilus sp.]
MRNLSRFTAALAAAMLSSAFIPVVAPAQSSNHQGPLQLVTTYHLPADIKGHFDHIVVDVKGNRLFATPEDYHAVLVLSTSTGKLIHQIQGIEKPHAILFRPDLNLLYITDGEDGSVKVFNATSYKLEHRIPLLKDADSISYDPQTHYLYVDNGGGDVGQKYSMLSVIDTNKFTKIADIKIDGDTLEAMALDPNRPQLYVNNRDKNQVQVVNRYTRALVAAWPITMGKTNVTMAYDVSHHRLFVGCRSGQMVVLDADSGKELQALPIVKGVDDTAFDEASGRIYSAGDGAMSVYQEIDANHYKLLGNIPTGPLGKTARLVPEMNRMFIAVPQHGSTDPSIMVFKPVGAKTTAESAPPAQLRSVSAPAAERLVMQTMSKYTCLNKLGIHAVPPRGGASVVIANGNRGKIGKESSEKDFADIRSGTTYCHPDEDGAFFDMKLRMFDASGHQIGMLVMEIPFNAVKDSASAIGLAEKIRQEMSAQIPSLNALFQS